jgi:DNA polymerase III epsilon subunit-like protein
MILFFDTETNGLWKRELKPDHADQPHLVSLAFQTCKEEEIVGQFSFRMQPKLLGFKIPEEVVKIHGISEDEANETGVPTEYALRLFAEQLKNTDTLVAHNLAFDLKIIQRAFDLFAIKFVKPKNLHCTMMMAKDVMKLKGQFKDYKFPKLQECFEAFFHTSPQKYHDALLDVQLCRELYFHLKRKDVEIKGPQVIPTELLIKLEGESYDRFVIFLNGLNPKKLTQWELDFGNSMKERLPKFDNHFLLSNKQLEILRKLYKKNDQND